MKPNIFSPGEYRKRPIVVEAARLTESNIEALTVWCRGKALPGGMITIPTLEGIMAASAGDWIIRGVQGEFIAVCREWVPDALNTLQRVRELHAPVEIEPSDTICRECSYQLPNGKYFGKLVEYPCPTIRALDEKEPANDHSHGAACHQATITLASTPRGPFMYSKFTCSCGWVGHNFRGIRGNKDIERARKDAETHMLKGTRS